MKPEGTRPPHPDRAKAYSRLKLALGIASSVLSFALLVVLAVTDASGTIAAWCRSAVGGDYPSLLLFAACIGVLQSAVTIPLAWYSGYRVEHRFGLSNQSLARWAGERAKALMVGAPLAAGMLCVLYVCLQAYGPVWWVPVGAVLTLLTVVLARLAPVLIMPIFYRFTPLGEGSLKDRIMQLCDEAGVQVNGIFAFDLSKNTRKANAAFTGIGRSRRIILGDTLVKQFSEDEIETVFAHELGHYRFGHIRKGIAMGTLSTFAGLFIAAHLYGWSAGALGYAGITDLGALPLLGIWLSLFGMATSPLGHALSRRHERQADAYAVTTTGKREAFVSALRKLGTMNLADPDPHPLVELLFYSHPTIARRIRAVESADR
ncbi:MAG: M48 family metallopeptidase [Bacteroidota bacterium]